MQMFKCALGCIWWPVWSFQHCFQQSTCAIVAAVAAMHTQESLKSKANLAMTALCSPERRLQLRLHFLSARRCLLRSRLSGRGAIKILPAAGSCLGGGCRLTLQKGQMAPGSACKENITTASRWVTAEGRSAFAKHMRHNNSYSAAMGAAERPLAA